MINSIGFTGTRKGMTDAQKRAIADIIADQVPALIVHGGCYGADGEFDTLCVLNSSSHTLIRVRPSNIPNTQAKLSFHACREIMPAKPPLSRNHNIVDDAVLMLATPRGFEEEQRSGTWAAIRYARKTNKPLIIIYPDGQTPDKARVLQQLDGDA